jgi:radical SAM protein (TIGR01212 family)
MRIYIKPAAKERPRFNTQTGRAFTTGKTRDFEDALKRLEKTSIKVCVHVMNGLPFEDKEGMLKTVKDISHLPFDAIKIHMLHVLRGTALGAMYEKEPFGLLSMEEYVETVCMQLAYLPPETVVARLTGDGAAKDLIAPMWTRAKRAVIAGIDRHLASHDMVQGMYFAR